MPLLDGKVAIVTGASSGIGRAVALAFAREGAGVVVADHGRNADGGRRADGRRHRGRRRNGHSSRRPTLPTGPASTRSAATRVARFGRIDVLVNNAAVYTSTNLLQTTPEQWSRVIGVNLTGFFYCCKRAVPRC